MSNQKLPYPVRPLYPAVPATDVTPSYQPPMNPYPPGPGAANQSPYPPPRAANPSPYPPPSSSIYPSNPIPYPPMDPSQASVYPPPNNPGTAPPAFNPNLYPGYQIPEAIYPPQNPNVYPSNPVPYPPIVQNHPASGNVNPSQPSLYPPQTPGYPNPSAPPLLEIQESGTEPPVNLFNVDVNEGGGKGLKSKFMKGVMDSGMQIENISK